MKIVAVLGSPHGVDGSTGTLVNSLLDGARNAGAETEIFSLSELAVGHCAACQTCVKTGKCQLVDDMPTITRALKNADGYVFASPNQVYNVSGLMKTLIDRCFSACYLQMGRGKYGAAVVTSGGPFFDAPEEYLVRFLGIIGCYSVGSVGAAQMQLEDDDERADVLGTAFRIGEEMVEAIKTKKQFPDQDEKLQEIFETMQFLVEMRGNDWPYTFKYWQKNFELGKDE